MGATTLGSTASQREAGKVVANSSQWRGPAERTLDSGFYGHIPPASHESGCGSCGSQGSDGEHWIEPRAGRFFSVWQISLRCWEIGVCDSHRSSTCARDGRGGGPERVI